MKIIANTKLTGDMEYDDDWVRKFQPSIEELLSVPNTAKVILEKDDGLVIEYRRAE